MNVSKRVLWAALAVSCAVGMAPAAAPTGTASLLGTTLDAAARHLPDTRVQVRNLRSGNLEQSTVSDGAGAFAFRSLLPGTYVVEMTLVNGSVVAISDAVVLADAQQARTVVQLPARFRGFAWWLGSATTVALAQAASLGVLAVNGGQPVTPQQ